VLKAMQAMEGYSGFCSHAVDRKRQAEPTDDLMSVLVHAEVDGDRLSPDDVLHESLLILVGGDETTRHVISGGRRTTAAASRPAQLLVDDPRRSPSRSRRCCAGCHQHQEHVPARFTHDTEFMGQEMTAGQKCMLLFESATATLRFDDPSASTSSATRTSTSRSLRRALLSRTALARLELKVMFEQLLVRLPDLELAADPADSLAGAPTFISGARIDAGPVSPEPAVAAERRVNNRELVEKLWDRFYKPRLSDASCRVREHGSNDIPIAADDVHGADQIALGSGCGSRSRASRQLAVCSHAAPQQRPARAKPDRHRFEPADEVGAPAREIGGIGRELRSGRRTSSCFEHHLQLESRSACPRQKCAPKPNATCSFGSRSDVEAEGIVEPGGVAVADSRGACTSVGRHLLTHELRVVREPCGTCS